MCAKIVTTTAVVCQCSIHHFLLWHCIVLWVCFNSGTKIEGFCKNATMMWNDTHQWLERSPNADWMVFLQQLFKYMSASCHTTNSFLREAAATLSPLGGLRKRPPFSPLHHFSTFFFSLVLEQVLILNLSTRLGWPRHIFLSSRHFSTPLGMTQVLRCN